MVDVEALPDVADHWTTGDRPGGHGVLHTLECDVADNLNL